MFWLLQLMKNLPNLLHKILLAVSCSDGLLYSSPLLVLKEDEGIGMGTK